MTAAAYDLVITGGGLVGATLAGALAHLPLRIAVVESIPFGAAEQPSYDDRCIALAYGSRRIIEGLGLWDRISGAATPISQIHVSDRGHFGAARMTAADYGFEALGYVVENRSLGTVLSRALAAQPNVDLYCPATLETYSPDNGAIRATISCDDGTVEIRGRLLVGADGGRSRVRSLASIDDETTDYGQTAIIANVSPAVAHKGVAFERFTARGPLALLPMSGGRCSLVWTVATADADTLLRAADGTFLGGLQQAFGWRLGRLEQTGRRTAYPLALVRARKFVGDRVVLIGNAAHTLHPIAGQGFNLGIRDVALLAEHIAETVRCQGDLGGAAMLERYRRSREDDYRRIIGLTDTLVKWFSNDFFPAVALRNLGLVAFDRVPPLKQWLMRRTMGLSGRLPSLARGLPL